MQTSLFCVLNDMTEGRDLERSYFTLRECLSLECSLVFVFIWFLWKAKSKCIMVAIQSCCHNYKSSLPHSHILSSYVAKCKCIVLH